MRPGANGASFINRDRLNMQLISCSLCNNMTHSSCKKIGVVNLTRFSNMFGGSLKSI